MFFNSKQYVNDIDAIEEAHFTQLKDREHLFSDINNENIASRNSLFDRKKSKEELTNFIRPGDFLNTNILEKSFSTSIKENDSTSVESYDFYSYLITPSQDIKKKAIKPYDKDKIITIEKKLDGNTVIALEEFKQYDKEYLYDRDNNYLSYITANPEEETIRLESLKANIKNKNYGRKILGITIDLIQENRQNISAKTISLVAKEIEETPLNKLVDIYKEYSFEEEYRTNDFGIEEVHMKRKIS
jgi:hypothetical protein